jgi:hypothetical protein
MPDADNMELIDQVSVYNQCGLKIKSDLLGNLDLLPINYCIDLSKKSQFNKRNCPSDIPKQYCGKYHHVWLSIM